MTTHLLSSEIANEEREIQCRRLLFRCWHRGTQESDLVLGSFAEMSLAELDDVRLGQFEALLDCSDVDLFDWIFGGIAPPPEHDHDLMRALRAFCVAGLRRPPENLRHWS